MEFNEKLQELRKAKGMTQEELANELYVSRTAISKWESGKGYPNIDSLRAISKYFLVSLDDLLSSEEILDAAETELKTKVHKLKDIIFGTLDCTLIIFFFFPFFGQKRDGVIEHVSLINFTECETYIKAPYMIGLLSIVLLGFLTLVLQNYNNRIWLQNKSKISLLLSVILTMFFIMSTEPYAAAFTFLFLIIKSIMLIKWA